MMARERLPSNGVNRTIKWWDEETPAREAEKTDVTDSYFDPHIDPSPRGRVDRLIETFVCGWPRDRLVRKAGFGMEPPFQRMRPPRASVVEMRTQATRTFGFFARTGVFVAHQLDLADQTHGKPRLYEKYGDEVLKLLDRVSVNDKDEISDVEVLIGN